MSLDNRTRALVKGLQRVSDVKLLTTRVEELSLHLLEFPETRAVAIKVSVRIDWTFSLLHLVEPCFFFFFVGELAP